MKEPKSRNLRDVVRSRVSMSDEFLNRTQDEHLVSADSLKAQDAETLDSHGQSPEKSGLS
jgi:hypothetical protein